MEGRRGAVAQILILIRVVFMWVLFSALLLWKFVHDKMFNLHFETDAW